MVKRGLRRPRQESDLKKQGRGSHGAVLWETAGRGGGAGVEAVLQSQAAMKMSRPPEARRGRGESSESKIGSENGKRSWIMTQGRFHSQPLLPALPWILGPRG